MHTKGNFIITKDSEIGWGRTSQTKQAGTYVYGLGVRINITICGFWPQLKQNELKKKSESLL